MRGYRVLALTIQLFCLISLPASATSIIDQFHKISGPINGPIDSLYFDLGTYQINCFMFFSIARLEPTAQHVGEARECLKKRLVEGNDSIAKVRTIFSKPNAQAALKELAFYWREQMTEVNLQHSDDEEIEILRLLKTYTERVRLEADW